MKIISFKFDKKTLKYILIACFIIFTMAITTPGNLESPQLPEAPQQPESPAISDILQATQSAIANTENTEDIDAFENWKKGLKERFEAFPQLHEQITWEQVEQALLANPTIAKSLQAIDANGHATNVFGIENGELIIASAWTNYKQVAPEHRYITYNKDDEKIIRNELPESTVNGNAVDIAASFGLQLAEPKHHTPMLKLAPFMGWTWLNSTPKPEKLDADDFDEDSESSEMKAYFDQDPLRTYGQFIGTNFDEGTRHGEYGSLKMEARLKLPK